MSNRKNNTESKVQNVPQYIRLKSPPAAADPGYVKIFYLDAASGMSEGLYTIDHLGSLQSLASLGGGGGGGATELADLSDVNTAGASENDILVRNSLGIFQPTPIPTKNNIGLGNVDNTSDANKPISTATQAALDLKANISSLATVATTGSYNNLLNLPTLGTAASTSSADYATAAQGSLADSAVQPDDLSDVATTGEYSDLNNVPDLSSHVTSVNSKSGPTVNLVKADIGLGNVDNTSDANKPISTAQAAALALKANTTDLAAVATSGDYNDLANTPAAGVTTVNTRSGDVVLAKSDVGLANVNNTSDLNKPISTATQAALDLKANISSVPTNLEDLGQVDLTGITDGQLLKWNAANSRLEPASDLNSGGGGGGATNYVYLAAATQLDMGERDTWSYAAPNSISSWMQSQSVSGGAPVFTSTNISNAIRWAPRVEGTIKEIHISYYKTNTSHITPSEADVFKFRIYSYVIADAIGNGANATAVAPIFTLLHEGSITFPYSNGTFKHNYDSYTIGAAIPANSRIVIGFARTGTFGGNDDFGNQPWVFSAGAVIE